MAGRSGVTLRRIQDSRFKIQEKEMKVQAQLTGGS